MKNDDTSRKGATSRPIEASTVLDLTGEVPVAKGTYREIFLFPGRPDVVVKVLKAGAEWRSNRPIRNFLKARSTRQLYRFMFREYEAYLEAKLRQITSPGPLPITDLYWLQNTSLGLGMAAERVRGLSGNPAKSLGALKRSGGLSPPQLEALNRFIARVEQLDIVVNDTNPENILLDEAGDVPRFILVDGYGDPNPLQIKRLSFRLRKNSRGRRWQKMADFLGMVWNANTETLQIL